jgi:hypothetical protein
MTKRSLLPLLAVFAATCTPVQIPSNLPPDPPSFQKAAPSMGGTKLTWRNATDSDFAGTVVVRYAGTPDGAAPSTVPVAGDAFGSGTVLYSGTDATAFDATLPDGCKVFTYQFWSYDRAGQWSAAVEALTLPGGLPGPSSGPTMLTAALSSSSVQLTWAPPASGAGATQSKIVRQLGMPAPTDQQGTQVYLGTDVTTVDPLAGLPKGQTLFYSAFGCNACGACSTLSSSAMLLIPQPIPDAGMPDAGPETSDGGMDLQPSGMSASLSSDGQTVQLSWTNPVGATGFTQVKVMRQLNQAPAGPDDGTATTLFTGLATSTSERLDALLPTTSVTPRTYFYSVFGCANASCESKGAQAMFTATLKQALHAGGYNIWWRHLPASDCSDEVQLGVCTMNGSSWICPSNEWWKSCVDDTPNCASATARQLTPSASDVEGQEIHDQFMQKGFVVGRVLASEFCRAQHSALSWKDASNVNHPGFDFGPAVESVKELTYYVYDEANRCHNTQTLLNEVPTQGTNTAMISHAGFSCSINGGTIDSNNWGDGSVFKPDANNGPIFIQRLAYTDWATLQ